MFFVFWGLGSISTGRAAKEVPENAAPQGDLGLAFIVLVFIVCGAIALHAFSDCATNGTC